MRVLLPQNGTAELEGVSLILFASGRNDEEKKRKSPRPPNFRAQLQELCNPCGNRNQGVDEEVCHEPKARIRSRLAVTSEDMGRSSLGYARDRMERGLGNQVIDRQRSVKKNQKSNTGNEKKPSCAVKSLRCVCVYHL